VGVIGGRTLALEPAVRAVRRAAAARRHPLVLVDGPSGAGKATFTASLLESWPGERPCAVRVDESIPGWRGLRRGAATLAASLVDPHWGGRVGVLHRWDWHADRPGPVERRAPGGPLVVDGCGAFLAGAGRADAVRVWIDAPYVERRDRALARDRGAFDPYWDGWEADWRRYLDQAGVRRTPAIRVRLGDGAERGA
jgi:hypothetical protein